LIAYFLRGLALGLPAAVTPGPLQAFLLSQTLKNGWRRTLPAALAPLLSDGPIVALVVLVLTQLPPLFLRAIQIAGGLFILYLAWQTFRATRQPAQPETVVEQPSSRQSLGQAALMNLLNPNPYIFWSIAAGPALLAGWRESAGHGLSFLLGFYGTLIGGFAGLILLFGVTQRIDPRLSRALAYLAVVALLLFGLDQLARGLIGGGLGAWLGRPQAA
jgi:threonine/homoserine/homoserine lactone efflux protein